MSLKRKYVLFVLTLATVSGLLIYQNCSGYNERSTDFSVSLDQVDSYYSQVNCAVQSNSDGPTQSAMNLIPNIQNEAGYDYYFSLVPSSMGNLDIVAPLDYTTLRSFSDNKGAPQSLWGFLAVGPDGTGSLALAFSDSSGSTTVPTPTPATIVQNVFKKAGKSFSKNHILASSTSQCTTSNPLNLDTVVAAYNDGTMGLEMATFDGDIFEMELNLDNATTLLVRSYDVEDGALQGVIQLEVYQIDSTGAENYLGDINMTQPDS